MPAQVTADEEWRERSKKVMRECHTCVHSHRSHAQCVPCINSKVLIHWEKKLNATNRPLRGMPGYEVPLSIEEMHTDLVAARAAGNVAVEEVQTIELQPVADGAKPTNPKDMIGSSKLPLHLWPSTASALGSLGLLNGMLKYGRTNWRVAGVRASIYVDAAKRHIDAWFEGEECDPEDGVPHLAAALACLAIIVDARAAGKLNDDRMVAGGYRKIVEECTPHVARLKTLHASKAPHHYTIADNAA